jgi:hypothetical protein
MRTLLIASSSILAALALSAQAQDLGGKEDARPQPSTAETALPTDAPDVQAAAAATPSAANASASVSARSTSTGAIFKAKVGSYPMSHYASPSRPIPYEQLDAYLKASPSQQLARNWWTGTELAETATSGNVSTTVRSSGTAGIPGDTNVSLNSDTQAPISDVQRQLNASGLSGTPRQNGEVTAPPNDALTPGAPAAEGLPEPTP